MNEENNFNENQNVQPLEAIAEPTSVEQQPVVEATMPEPTEPKEKKSNKTIIIIAVVLVLLAGGGYAVWQFLLPSLNKDNKETTTTTTTTETTTSVEDVNPHTELTFNSVVDYFEYVKNNKTSQDIEVFLPIDNKFFAFDFFLKEKCVNEGDKVSFEHNGLKYNYTCTDDTANWGDDLSNKIWKTEDAIINGTYKTKRSYSTCGTTYYYSNGQYFVTAELGCGVAPSPNLKIEDANNNVIYSGKYLPITYGVSLETEDHMGDVHYTPIISKDNVLFFITQEGHLSNGSSECLINYVDFNISNPRHVVGGANTYSCLDLDI